MEAEAEENASNDVPVESSPENNMEKTQLTVDPNVATMQQQLDLLRRIDALVEKLQKENKMMESLQQMEKSLILRGHCFGLDSIEVFQACKAVGELCNYLAMMHLNYTRRTNYNEREYRQFRSARFKMKGKEDKETNLDSLTDIAYYQARFTEEENARELKSHEQALLLLRKAEIVSERHPVIRAVTYNNLGCYYRKKGKLRTALSYVEKAIEIESRYSKGVRAADTHINACTILSELHRHETAYKHAVKAQRLMMIELFAEEETSGDNGNNNNNGEEEDGKKSNGEGGEGEGEGAGGDGGEGGGDGENEDKKKDDTGKPADRLAVLAIAYYNMAVQLEYLRRYIDALVSYEKAYKVAAKHLPEGHYLSKKLEAAYQEAKGKLEGKVRRKAMMLEPSGPAARPTLLPHQTLLQLEMGIAAAEKAGGGEEGEGEGEGEGGEGGEGEE